MKIVLINTSENRGGAAVACKRLMIALKKQGISVKMLVRDKQTTDPDVMCLSYTSPITRVA
ncbi:MAG: glycosyl transferase, partial [Odoribacter sp.]|nr:glycosyl transferase [Odoribacter sp.]